MAATKHSKASEAAGLQFIFAAPISTDDDDPITLEGLTPAHTVLDIKGMIAEKVGYARSGEGIQVVFAGTVMDDSGRSLSSYGVSNGDIVYFTPSVADAPPAYQDVPTITHLFFRDIDGKTLTLSHLPVNMKIGDMTKKLGKEKAMDVDWLRFIWSGKQLVDGNTLSDYGITNESTIHIVARLMGGGVLPQ